MPKTPAKPTPNWWGWEHIVQDESLAFYQTCMMKNTMFIFAMGTAFVACAMKFEPHTEPPSTPGSLAGKVLLAFMSISMIYVSMHVMPPPIHHPREERMDVMKVVGSPAYVGRVGG